MKRLVDESTDELTRLLLEAGRTHQPPSGNEAKLLLSLGVGGSVGLFSSKAFAWLGSGAGKLTLVGVGVGIAGVAYTLASPHSARVDARSAVATAVGSPVAGSPVAGSPVAGSPVTGSPVTGSAAMSAAPSVASSTVLPEHVVTQRAALQPRAAGASAGASGAELPSGAEPSNGVGSSVASSIAGAPAIATVAADSLPDAPLEHAHGSHRRAHGRRGRLAATSRHVLSNQAQAAVESEASASLGSAAATNGATERGGEASEAARSAVAGSESAGSESAGSESASAASAHSQAAAHARGPGLDSEVALVDAMRSALARGDGAALHRLIESYRGNFPHGQLQAEVAELAARPLPSGH